MNDQKRVLLVSRDLMLLQTRKLILGAYFDVTAAGRVLEASKFLAERPFDLVVLCYTLTDDDFQNISESVRRYSPDAKFLTLTVTGHPARRPGNDSYCLATERGPFLLVKKSAELLGFEFRSKGRMVQVARPGTMVA